VYTIYSILFIVFIILIIVTAFITVALTYFQLAVEDHRWWWRSFLCGGSTGGPTTQFRFPPVPGKWAFHKPELSLHLLSMELLAVPGTV
jgi:hypothetical protein